MSLTDIYTILNTIPAFRDKVAYRAFPKGKAPKLPYICYLATQTDNFKADDSVYKVIQGIDIPASEALVEEALQTNGIVWEKYEEYLDDENMYMITYETEV